MMIYQKLCQRADRVFGIKGNLISLMLSRLLQF